MCPICHENKYIVIGLPSLGSNETRIITQDYKVVKCNHCAIYYINPPINLSKNEWENLYRNDYFDPMTKWHKKRREKDRIKRFNNMEKYSSHKIKTFLDIGCGEGYGLLEAESRGWNTFGVDIADNRLQQAMNNNITFINNDLMSAHFSDDFFDVVYMDSVLEHVLNPHEYLLEIKRIMKKGGIFYIGIPNEDSLLNTIKRIIYKFLGNDTSPKLKPFKSPYHVIGFNKKTICLTLHKTNLKVRKIRNFACRVEFLKSKPFTKDYFQSLLLFPIYLLAIPLRKEVYLEVYVEKI